MATTHAQAKKQKEQELDLEQKDRGSETTVNQASDTGMEWIQHLDDDLFGKRFIRPVQSQKRHAR